ncbi:MAG: DUF4242 domain-containing protein, partial [Actinomycetota bacterium]|nr:DUF4242 domain-containing protein [Actinomycetota bacterium]
HEAAARARAAADQAARAGTPVRYVRSIFVPEDEICFHVYEAESAALVGETVTAAELGFERIVENSEYADAEDEETAPAGGSK